MLKSILKKLALTAIFTLIIAPYSMVINPAYAGSASLSFSDPSGVYLIRGCTGQIQIRLDSGGENVLASDTTTTLTGDATLNSGSIGSALPMQTYNIVNGSELKLSGARYASTGAFTGSGTFGTISITPNATGSISLDFTGDLSLDNNIVNDSIVNVLGSVTGATYTVNERYNVDISGGFCTPDTTAPTYTLADPTANSTNNAVDTDVSFTLTDNRVGVNITTLSFLIDGVSYTEDSAQVTYQENSGSYLVTTNPDTDFSLGSKVDVTVSVCDNEGNCLSNQTKSFYTTPPPSCGNEVIEGGEECDNGMGNHDLDTCTSTCQNAECGDGLLLWGVEECDGGDNCTEDCLLIEEEVEPVECAECAECEAAVHEAAPDEDTVYQSPDEVSGEDQEEAAAEASDALSQQQTSTGVGYGISIPDQVDTVIQNCMELYPNLNFEEGTSEDSDGDGLSNRTECYNGTLPDNSDTDGDSCTDGDEVNTFQTNPLIVDCDESDIVDEEVIITDPQAGWIVRKLEVHGITPEDSDYVDVVAFPAEYSVIQDLMNAVTDVVNSGGIAMNDLMTALNQAQSFVDENS
ncbi:Ig-like domain-containing protein, partial [Patescibacteria group bacterium]|nr:Ig-like domain-containing protein [Patescibacteria group bacterium]